MNTHPSIASRARHAALLLGLTAILPALAACPPDTFVDQANFSHLDDDPAADGGFDQGSHAVATNGKIVAYGMVGNVLHDVHHVYLYQQGASPGQWSFLKRLDQPGFRENYDSFAEVLAMDGDTLVVGARGAGVDAAHDAGAVYVYRRDAGGTNMWGSTQSVYYAGINGFGQFGASVDIHRNRMLVGAYQAGDGRAVVYERSSASADFVAVAELLPPAADLADVLYFGVRVALYGDVAVVSDYGFKQAADTFQRGRVYVYARNQGGTGHWGLVTTLISPASTPPSGTREFGFAISVWGSDDKTRGETIAVTNHNQVPGHVFLFSRDAGGADNWGQIVDLEPGDSGSAEFGSSLHLHSNELLVGDAAANGVASVTGAVYVFHQQTGGSNNWGQVQKFYSQSNDYNSNYGYALDWSAGVAVVGDPLAGYGSDYKVGRAYVLFDDLIFCDPFE